MPGLTFVATCDLAAQVRGRAVPGTNRDGLLRRGVGWVPADLAINAFGDLADNVFGSIGDLRLLPVAGAVVDLPAADGSRHELRLAGQVTTAGEAWECCPRALAQSALDAFRRRTGTEVVASFEHEFVLTGLPESAPFSWERFRQAEHFGTELVQILADNDLEPETWLPEYAPGQFEITLRPAPALIAADRAVLLREIVRDLARRHGLGATFAPLTRPDGVGNGVHVHLSLVDPEGWPALYDDSRPAALSALGSRLAGGILAHAGALVALTAPSPVSFLRLQPHRWSVAGAFLADRNREAMLRLCPTSTLGDADPAAQFNLEFRAADATANPWLVIAGLMLSATAGLDGPEPTLWPETMTEAEMAATQQLPGDLAEALKQLEADEVLAPALGADLLDTYLSVKRSELAALADLDDEEKCRRVCDVY